MLGDDEVELGQIVVGQVMQPAQVGIIATRDIGETLVECISPLGIALKQPYLIQ